MYVVFATSIDGDEYRIVKTLEEARTVREEIQAVAKYTIEQIGIAQIIEVSDLVQRETL